MRKYLPIALSIVLIAAGCQFKTDAINNKDPRQQKDSGNIETMQSNIADWKRIELPGWDIVSFSYPPDWSYSLKSKGLINLSKGSTVIYVAYKADERLTNPLQSKPVTEADVINEYISSLGSIHSRTTSYEGRETGSEQVEVLKGRNTEIHNIFFIGTLLVDVYTQQPRDSAYSEIIKSFQYGGF